MVDADADVEACEAERREGRRASGRTVKLSGRRKPKLRSSCTLLKRSPYVTKICSIVIAEWPRLDTKL